MSRPCNVNVAAEKPDKEELVVGIGVDIRVGPSGRKSRAEKNQRYVILALARTGQGQDGMARR